MISYFPLYVLNLRVECAVSFKNFCVLFWSFYGLPVFKPDKAAVALVPDFFEYFGVVDFARARFVSSRSVSDVEGDDAVPNVFVVE